MANPVNTLQVQQQLRSPLRGCDHALMLSSARASSRRHDVLQGPLFEPSVPTRQNDLLTIRSSLRMTSC